MFFEVLDGMESVKGIMILYFGELYSLTGDISVTMLSERLIQDLV